MKKEIRIKDELLPLDYLKKEKFKKYILQDRTNCTCFIELIIMIIAGLINFQYSQLYYYFGLLFFLAGFTVCISQNTKVSGIIFLFLHGSIGLLIMVGVPLSVALNNPILTDSASKAPSIYITTFISCLILATITSIIYNLSDKLKKVRYYKLIPLSLFTIAIVLITILPLILQYLCKLKI